jgi:hypothetical protein
MARKKKIEEQPVVEEQPVTEQPVVEEAPMTEEQLLAKGFIKTTEQIIAEFGGEENIAVDTKKKLRVAKLLAPYYEEYYNNPNNPKPFVITPEEMKKIT